MSLFSFLCVNSIIAHWIWSATEYQIHCGVIGKTSIMGVELQAVTCYLMGENGPMLINLSFNVNLI